MSWECFTFPSWFRCSREACQKRNSLELSCFQHFLKDVCLSFCVLQEWIHGENSLKAQTYTCIHTYSHPAHTVLNNKQILHFCTTKEFYFTACIYPSTDERKTLCFLLQCVFLTASYFNNGYMNDLLKFDTYFINSL